MCRVLVLEVCCRNANKMESINCVCTFAALVKDIVTNIKVLIQYLFSVCKQLQKTKKQQHNNLDCKMF